MSCVPNTPDNMTDGLEKFISEYITQEMTGVEIGCFEGVSTELFAHACGKLYAVDPFDLSDVQYNGWLLSQGYSMCQAYRAFKRRLRNLQNVHFQREFSRDNHRYHADNSLDFVYIDGAHDYLSVVLDIENYYPKIKPGGVIAGHDWDYPYGQVKQAVRFMLGEPDKVFEDTTWVIRKPIIEGAE